MSFVELIPDIPKASKGHDKHLRTIYDREQLYMYRWMIWIIHIWMMASFFVQRSLSHLKNTLDHSLHGIIALKLKQSGQVLRY